MPDQRPAVQRELPLETDPTYDDLRSALLHDDMWALVRLLLTQPTEQMAEWLRIAFRDYGETATLAESQRHWIEQVRPVLGRCESLLHASQDL